MAQILWFKNIGLDDVQKVGGKNASLGEMIKELSEEGVIVPDGFATTSSAYFEFLEKAGIKEEIENVLSKLDVHDVEDLNKKSAQIREIITNSELPQELKEEIAKYYKELSQEYGEEDTDVAVRSSATAEDMPTASFAGLHETFLNVSGEENLILAVKKCMSSLFTSRAISYREEKGFTHMNVALSVGVQKMARSDLACSGVMFTLDTESGFSDVVLVNSTWGLGEMIVQGEIIPDEFFVAKELVSQGYPAIVKKECGIKSKKMIYQTDEGIVGEEDKVTKVIDSTQEEKRSFTLSDEEILQLGKWGMQVEDHYSKKAGEWRPMDIEWAKDGKTGKLFLIQARPETVYGVKGKERKTITEYKLKEEGKVLAEGVPIGNKIGQGKVNVIKNVDEIGDFQEGEVLVTEMTDPDWEPIMKKAAAIVTDKGGRTCHSAIVSRELGIPCIVGTRDASENISSGEEATIDCSQAEKGRVFQGKLSFEKEEHKLEEIPNTKTKINLNIGAPDSAFRASFLPNDGVGLAREEFIFISEIKIHPLALLKPQKVSEEKREEIDKITAPYETKTHFFVEKLAQGISRIATGFYPKEVIVRFSDFKTNEYAQLIGGEEFEPSESNPMLGWRGASRYYSKEFKEAFLLECKAVKKAREEYGFSNITVMIPFCRTPEEARKTLELMKEAELISSENVEERGKEDPEIYIMCEIPSNVMLADEFLKLSEGFSIGTNDLTQLTLGMDRDSAIIAKIADERNEALKELVAQAVARCNALNKYSGICGDAPSTFKSFARFLVDCGIQSISVNPDVAIKTHLTVAEEEKKKEKSDS